MRWRLDNRKMDERPRSSLDLNCNLSRGQRYFEYRRNYTTKWRVNLTTLYQLARRRMHTEELHTMNASPNIIRVIKLRRVRWEEHVACVGETKHAYAILVGKPERKRPLGSKGVYGKSILEWIHLAQDRDQ
jgi:hypothetical protein